MYRSDDQLINFIITISSTFPLYMLLIFQHIQYVYYTKSSDTNRVTTPLPRGERCNLDNQTRENIIRVMDMGILLNDIRVAALFAYRMQRLTFTYHINLVARSLGKTIRRRRRYLAAFARLAAA